VPGKGCALDPYRKFRDPGKDGQLAQFGPVPVRRRLARHQLGKIKTLHAWMKKADASGIYRMQRFVRTLKQDQSAVEAAVEQSWSNGPVEGHINRLKTLKRQMYGRAGFELLRARVLPLPPPTILHQE
jgi:hypothetical protein